MAVIGQALTSPEATWRRYDDRSAIAFIGRNWVNYPQSGAYNSNIMMTTNSNDTCQIRFYGSKFRLFTDRDTSRDPNGIVKVYVDDVLYGTYSTYGNSGQCILSYEVTGLNPGVHTIKLTTTDIMTFDCIDVDDYPNGYLMHPVLPQKTKIEDMEIGDCIPARYYARHQTSPETIGAIGEIGTSTADEIPTRGGGFSRPQGLFYFIKVDKGLLVADRTVQTNVPYTALHWQNIIHGRKCFLENHNNINYQENYHTHDSIPVMIEYNGELYGIWSEQSGSRYLQVKKWRNGVWQTIKQNFSINSACYNPTAIVYNDELLIFTYDGGNLRCCKYNSTTEVWTNDVFNTLQYATTSTYPSVILFNNNLYLFWNEANKIRYKMYDGTTWTTDTLAGPSNSGLTYGMLSFRPVPIVYNNKLYVFWMEYNSANIYQVRYKVFDGTAWTTDGGDSGSNGLNYDSTKRVDNLDVTVYNGELYVFWEELTDAGQIRYKKFDGINWLSNNNVLNYNSTKQGNWPKAQVYNNKLYLFWHEIDATWGIWRVRYKYFDGNIWNVDNEHMNFTYHQHTQGWIEAIVFKNELYLAYSMNNSWYNAYNLYIKRISNAYDDALVRSLNGGVAYADDKGNCSFIDRGKGAWPTSNEHDAYLVKSTLNGRKIDNYDLWNLWDTYHWCKEVVNYVRPWKDFKLNVGTKGYNDRMIRGAVTSDTWRDVATSAGSTQSASLGFRPVIQYKDKDVKTTNLYY